jgi:WD40 repeat protein
VARVFISHASADLELASEVHRWLVAAGHQAFLDTDERDGLVVGDDWQRRLHERLRWADAVVCLITAAYATSLWCAAEVAVAQTRGSRLLPVLLDTGTQHPLLTTVQYVAAGAGLDGARPRLLAALRELDAIGPFGWPDGRSPYPGLRSFETDQKQVFFGRERETLDLAELVRSPVEHAVGALLVVVGPSGCGKSSLVRAGLIPAMAADDDWWTVPAFTPGTDPVAALSRELATAARLAGLTWTVAEVRRRLTDPGLAETADEILLTAPGGRRRRLLVVVDQLEELLTQATATERRRFAELLRPALSASVHVVATLRPEFLEQLLADEHLRPLPARVHALRPLQREALERVVEGPAALAGLELDDGLTSQLIDDTGSGEALPLLAYTLAELAEGIERGGKLLIGRYRQLRGVRGALARQADSAAEAAKEAGGRSRDEVIAQLLRLVTVDEQGRPTRWRVRHDELPEVVKVELDAFVARRLVVTDTDDGHVIVGIAHEAFLSAWPPLADAIATAASALRARRAAEQAAAEWVSDGRPTGLLWEGGRLAAGLSSTGRRDTGDPVELSAQAQEFLLTSARRDRRRRRRTTTVLSVLLVLALGAASLAAFQLQVAEERQRLATARLLLAQARSALTVDPRVAIRLGEAAYRTSPSPETGAGLVDLMSQAPFLTTLDGHTGTVYGVAFAAPGRLLATGGKEGTAILWDVGDPLRPRRLGEPLIGPGGAVYDLAFSPDGRLLAVAAGGGSVALWDLTEPAHPSIVGAPLKVHSGSVYATAFADERTLAALSDGGGLTLWDVAEPLRPRRLAELATGGTSRIVALATDVGHGVLVAATDVGVSLWDVQNPSSPRKLADNFTGTTGTGAVGFSSDGRFLATGEDDTAHLWDVSDPARPVRVGVPLAGHVEVINDVAFTPDGRTLATAGADGRAMAWDIEDPGRPRRLPDLFLGTSRTVFAVAFAPEGQFLVTTGTDSTAIMWNLANTTRPRRLGAIATGPVGTVMFAAGSDTLLTAGDVGVVRWQVADPATPQQLDDRDDGLSRATDLAVTGDGGVMATAAPGATTLWDVSDSLGPRRSADLPDGHLAELTALAAAAHVRLLATARADGTVVLWDVTDPSQPRQIGTVPTGSDPPRSTALTADGRVLAVAVGGNVQVWDVADGERPRRIGMPLVGDGSLVTAVAFGPSGRTLATAAEDGTAMLWDITEPARPRRQGDTLVGHTNRIAAVAFSPDGRTLATAADDHTAILWDLTDADRPHRLGDALDGNGAALQDVAFSADGRTLVTSGMGSDTVLWDLSGVDAVRAHPDRHACAMTGRGLDPTEWARYVPNLPYEDSCS